MAHILLIEWTKRRWEGSIPGEEESELFVKLQVSDLRKQHTSSFL
jgi:hypothetical protein